MLLLVVLQFGSVDGHAGKCRGDTAVMTMVQQCGIGAVSCRHGLGWCAGTGTCGGVDVMLVSMGP